MRPTGRMHLGDYLGTLGTWLRLQQQHECFFFMADWHALANSYQEAPAFRQRSYEMLVDWLAVGVDPHLATVFQQSRVLETGELYVLLSMCTPLSWLERVASARAEVARAAGSEAQPGWGSSAAHASAAAGPEAANGADTSAVEDASAGADDAAGAGAAAGADGAVPAGAAATPGLPAPGEPLTFGQIGYPLLQACDILIYQPTHVVVPEEQALHVELTRDVARRFNHLFGREEDGEERIRRAMRRLGRAGETYRACRRAYQEQGDENALRAGTRLLEEAPNLTMGDRERLVAHLEGGGRALLGEPEMLPVASPQLPGTDGRPMASERDNTIDLRDPPDVVWEKLRRMPTDPARVRRRDPGNPENCPVWRYHVVLGDDESRHWAGEGCRTARIGCMECKQRAAEHVEALLEPIRESARRYEESPEIVRSILVEGTDRARDVARDTMMEVRRAMRLDHS